MSAKEYARRRRHLMELIGAGGIAVLPAATEKVRSRDTLFDYRPDSDLYYLTGFVEPEAVAALDSFDDTVEHYDVVDEVTGPAP